MKKKKTLSTLLAKKMQRLPIKQTLKVKGGGIPNWIDI